jgi:hypothetical protein
MPRASGVSHAFSSDASLITSWDGSSCGGRASATFCDNPQVLAAAAAVAMAAAVAGTQLMRPAGSAVDGGW